MSLVKQKPRGSKPKAKSPWRRTVDNLNAVEKDKSYPETLAAVHGGESVNPDTLAKVLLAAGKISQQFEADLGLKQANSDGLFDRWFARRRMRSRAAGRAASP